MDARQKPRQSLVLLAATILIFSLLPRQFRVEAQAPERKALDQPSRLSAVNSIQPGQPVPPARDLSASGYSVFLPLIFASGGWVPILHEDFEGAFPGPWTLTSYSGPETGVYLWAKRTCRPFSGSSSGMAYGGGAAGSVLTCSDPQPDNMLAWMRYGPFSLADATVGELRFRMWINSEASYDWLFVLASTDGVNYCGQAYSGNSQGWVEQVLDLTSVYGLGNLNGQPSVRIAFVFASDYTADPPTYYDGAFIDGIVLQKCRSAACPYVPAGTLGPLVVKQTDCITPGPLGP